MKPRFDALISRRQPAGTMFGRRIGEAFSTLRHWVFDRFVDVERSYRGTLLGFHHGIAVVRLLREVAERECDDHVVQFCEEWLARRVPLVEAAERELRWFAEVPAKAIRSGLRVAFEPQRD